MLAIEGLAKTFVMHHRGGVELPVLRNVSLTVHSGECIALDGPSGVGKSTLLKLIHANYRATRGSIRVRCATASGEEESLELTTASPRELLSCRRSTMSYVSQFLRAIPRVSAQDVVGEPLTEQAGTDVEALRHAERTAQQLLLRLRIPARLWHLPPATFSGGEQQRINIARGLIRPAPLLLLDEPTASLDEDNRMTVSQLITEARERGAAIIGIFHDVKVRDAVATRVVDMAAFR